MELIRRASAEIEKLSLWRIFRNLWNDKAGSSLAHALGKAYLHQMPSFYDSNRDPSAMRKPTDSIEVMSAAPTVTRNRKPRQWGECFAPHLPLWIFKRGSATSVVRSTLLQLALKAALRGSGRPQRLCGREHLFLLNTISSLLRNLDEKNTHFRSINELHCEHIDCWKC